MADNKYIHSIKRRPVSIYKALKQTLTKHGIFHYTVVKYAATGAFNIKLIRTEQMTNVHVIQQTYLCKFICEEEIYFLNFV